MKTADDKVATKAKSKTASSPEPEVLEAQQPAVDAVPPGEQPRPEEAQSQSEAVELPLSEITPDAGLQCRASLNRRTVAEYAECVTAGDTFPPVTVFDIDDDYLLADGFHRVAAAKQAKRETIAVAIKQGNRRGALKFAILANTAHGLRFSNADKKRVVELALTEFPTLSAGLVADMCRVSQPFVSRVRRKLKPVLGSTTTTGKDGKNRKPPERKTTAAAADPTQETEAGDDTGRQPKNTSDHTDGTEITGSDSQPEQLAEKTNGYDFDQSWKKIEKFLRAEVKACAQNKHPTLQDKLYKFADGIC